MDLEQEVLFGVDLQEQLQLQLEQVEQDQEQLMLKDHLDVIHLLHHHYFQQYHQLEAEVVLELEDQLDVLEDQVEVVVCLTQVLLEDQVTLEVILHQKEILEEQEEEILVAKSMVVEAEELELLEETFHQQEQEQQMVVLDHLVQFQVRQ